VNRFSRWSALWASFYSRALYRDVASRWNGLGLIYLLMLLAFCWLPSPVRWSIGLREFAATNGQAMADQLPTIAIEDGVMTASPAGRHVVRLDFEDRRVDEGSLIIDDSVDAIVADDVTADTFILTRREAAMIRPARNERRVWALTPAVDMTVEPQDVANFFTSMAVWLPSIGYAGAVTGSFVTRFAQSLLYGAIAVAYARRRRVSLPYKAAIRLAIVAMTPVIVIRTVVWFNPTEPAWYWRWPAAIMVTLAYLAYGIRALAEPAEPANEPRGSGDTQDESGSIQPGVDTAVGKETIRGLRLWPIMAGLLADLIGTVLFAFGYAFLKGIMSMATDIESDELVATSTEYLTFLVYGLLATAAGGYVSGRLARVSPIAHAASVGILVFALSILIMLVASDLTAPVWFNLVSLGGVVPAAAIGGWLASRAKATALLPSEIGGESTTPTLAVTSREPDVAGKDKL
jgi:hypothetical protein